MNEHQENGDYVLVHKSKAKLSRSRRGIIGMMVVGAIAAVAGGGTFASFSASTTNDATFSTENLVMINNGTCESNGTEVEIDNSGGAASNDNTCGSLWAAGEDDIGTTYTKSVILTNGGNTGHHMFLWNEGICTSTASVVSQSQGDEDLCGAVKLTVQRTSGTGQSVACIFPTAACTDPATDGGAIEDGTANDFNSVVGADFAGKEQVTDAQVPANDTVTFTIKIHVPHHNTCGVVAAQDYDRTLAGLDNQTVAAGGLFNPDGVSCDNHYINKKAELLLKWWMGSTN